MGKEREERAGSHGPSETLALTKSGKKGKSEKKK
jgi:hypothetical protein